jgi:hypothetical protein
MNPRFHNDTNLRVDTSLSHFADSERALAWEASSKMRWGVKGGVPCIARTAGFPCQKTRGSAADVGDR